MTGLQKRSIGINRNDNYLSLFNGIFHAQVSGPYGWEIRGNDDRGTIWIDLDQDGVFEVAGNKGNEQMVYQPQCCGTQSTIVTLEAGYYAIAIAHGEAAADPIKRLTFIRRLAEGRRL